MIDDSARYFTRELLAWHTDHAPNHPWKENSSPYSVWLSEIIMQQTRVVTGKEYYIRFLKKYPTVHDLANADEEEVLADWQGLGYYNRARNLHATAKLISSQKGGRFPTHSSELLQLKGVGAYTAAAIASFSYDERIPVVDGNVYRVLSRYFADSTPVDLGRTSLDHYAELSDRCLAYAESSADYNQAIMDFGALVCKPKTPTCSTCPLRDRCMSYSIGSPENLPVKVKKTKVTAEALNYVVFFDEKKNTLFQKRSNDSYWPNLYQPILLPQKKNKRTQIKEMSQHYLPLSSPPKLAQKITHLLSHKKLTIRIFESFVPTLENSVGGILIKKEEILSRAMPQPLYLYFKNNYLT